MTDRYLVDGSNSKSGRDGATDREKRQRFRQPFDEHAAAATELSDGNAVKVSLHHLRIVLNASIR